ncbi:MAG: alanine--tRNA ligase [Planctomycetes bacterium]|nr:alanine--tRNA ligase [Planctomycetota bacterium]
MNTSISDTPTTAEIRRSFLEFFRDQAGHEIIPSGSVAPHDDPTLLFANAGMNQFKDVFLGTGTRPWTRVTDTQKCIRAGGKHNDLEDVGRDTYHHTFFEMLGNWSFGDYFKAEAISWAWQLLTEVWGLPKDRLYVTVFGGDEKDGLGADEETERLWQELTDIDPKHISRWGRKDNFWEMGATGPCGPCSEIHFDSTPDKSGGDLVNLDHPDVIEFWNLVFIQFNRRDDGSLVELPSRHVDTGMGLERIARILQGVRSNYDTDLWTPIFDAIQSRTSAAAYGGSLDDPGDVAYRVIADHVRCLAIALADGARPGSDGRGYVLRRILRRGVRMARQTLNADGPLLCELVPVVVGVLGEAFPELASQQKDIISIIKGEEEAFLATLDRGLKLFAEAAASARQSGGEIGGEQAFLLHDTYGFPIDLTAQMAEEQGLGLDRAAYEAAMEAAREKSRQGGSEGADPVRSLPPEVLAGLKQIGGHGTDDSPKYEQPLCIGHIRGVWNGKDLVEHIGEGEHVAVLLDRTTFYAEQGGQIGDTGRLVSEAEGDDRGGATFRVEDTTRSGPWVLHIGHMTEGRLHLGAAVDTRVDRGHHESIEANHTATHLLNRALRTVFGLGADQRGSLVAADRLRFDYAASNAPDIKDMARVEQCVREDVTKDLAVSAQEAPLDAAMQINGVRAMFGEKYPDPVRVVCVGADVPDLVETPDSPAWQNLSIEFCGGTHLASTAQIDDFMILQEQGLAAGIRRITAATGTDASDVRSRGEQILKRLAAMATLDPAELPDQVDAISREIPNMELGLVHRREVESQLASLRNTAKTARKAAAGAAKNAAVEDAKAIAADADEGFVIGEVAATDRDSLLAGMDTVRAAAPDAACLLACRPEDTGKVIIAARVPDALISQGLKAGDWVRVTAQACGGGGGGRPDAAQAGGKEPEKLPEALCAARAFAKETLT